jgi:predicted metalloprotease
VELNPDARPDTSEVEDQRGTGPGRRRAPTTGGLSRLSLGGGRLGGGLVGLLIVVLLLCLGLGAGRLGLSDLGALGGLGGAATQGEAGALDAGTVAQTCATSNPAHLSDLACRNLLFANSIQAYWRTALPQIFGVPYQTATTRFFSGTVSTGCGIADAGVGPFYCPVDQHVYIDLTFYSELARRFGAAGQFAQPYVLAHEYGHHIQNLLGTGAAVARAQQRDPGNANALSVAAELQADCYAGVWAFHAGETADASGAAIFTSITPDDIRQALDAAGAVGDDTVAKRAGVKVNEQGFTHGTAAQRQQWFTTGYTTGDPQQCTTFGGTISPA